MASQSSSFSLGRYDQNSVAERIRARTSSGVRLDKYQRLVQKTILTYQDPVSGLFPGSADSSEAWIRDNVYSVLSVWALGLAYKKNSDLDEDRAKAYELQERCVKNMRGLLACMMKQPDKVEKFKRTQSPVDSLHAKYGVRSLKTIVGDHQYGHLQIDAVSLYMLILAQMTASGVQIVYTLDEVVFIQNLVFYIEAAYRVADYGVWERGDKTNHGLPELNSSSVGMAKAALEALDDLDLFGSRGGSASVIHCIPDMTQKCHAVLQSMLPRESNSKEVDAAILSVIGFPAFAVEDPDLVKATRQIIVEKLQGKYGLKRFLRDGYRTCREDRQRLYYQPSELKAFENIECEWPMFFCYLLLDALFNNDAGMAEEYWEALEEVVIMSDEGYKIIPELYTLPADKVDKELKDAHSQERVPIGRVPFLWGQSLYILCCLIKEGFIACGEIDPLCRRYVTEKKPDVVVQMVMLAENDVIKERLRQSGIEVQTARDVHPIEVYPARVLGYIYSQLGKSRKMGFNGRASSEIGVLSTSTLYQLHHRTIAFMPHFLDEEHFYLSTDTNLLVDMFRTDIAFLKSNWRMLGRPTIILEITDRAFEDDHKPHAALLASYRKAKTGYVHGTRVVLGNLGDFLNTSCFYTLSFIGTSWDQCYAKTDVDKEIRAYVDQLLSQRYLSKSRLPTKKSHSNQAKRKLSTNLRSRTGSIVGIIRRTRSIQVDTTDPGMIDIRDRKAGGISSADDGLARLNSPQQEYLPKSVMGDQFFNYQLAESQKLDVDPLEMLDMLKSTESLGEQAEIIHYLCLTKGMDWDTRIAHRGGAAVTVADLMRELYEKACHNKKWWLVRYSAGMLDKRVEDLAKALSDLLVHQKQVTVGMPSIAEMPITRPLPPDELHALINEAHKPDTSTAMLTQELLMYLAMFVRTEPELFNDLLRLRIGLIVQIMAGELARALKCRGPDASEYLLNLSPFEIKTLLHHILSGKEIDIREDQGNVTDDIIRVAPLLRKERRSGINRLRKSIQSPHALMRSPSQEPDLVLNAMVNSAKVGAGDYVIPAAANGELRQDELDSAGELPEKTGRWLRRRRLDGALNRLPQDFYPRIWRLLEKGIFVMDLFLAPSLTNEMTAGEMKFALQVENILSTIAQPEFRQLLLESLMVLTMLVEYEPRCVFTRPFHIKSIVYTAYRMFLTDQITGDGDASVCCASLANLATREYWTVKAVCGGAAGICLHFYDSAPSGRYGTMTYLCRAAATELPMQFPSCSTDESQLECRTM